MDSFSELFGRVVPFSLLTLSLGAVVNIGCILAVVLVVRKRSSSFNNAISLAGFASVLAILVVAIAGHRYEWSRVQEAICALPEHMAALKLRGYADSMHAVSIGLHAILLPLILGVTLLVVELMNNSPGDGRPRNLLSILGFAACVALGAAMCLKALLDFLRFDDVLLLLSWI